MYFNKGKVIKSIVDEPARETHIKIICNDAEPFVFFDSSNSKARNGDIILFELEHLPSVKLSNEKTAKIQIKNYDAPIFESKIISATGKIIHIKRRERKELADNLIIDIGNIFVLTHYSGTEKIKENDYVKLGPINFGKVIRRLGTKNSNKQSDVHRLPRYKNE